MLNETIYAVIRLDNKLSQIKIYRIVRKILVIYLVVPAIRLVKLGYSNLSDYKHQHSRLFKQHLIIIFIGAVVIIIGYSFLTTNKDKMSVDSNKTVQLAGEVNNIDDGVLNTLSDLDARLMTLAKQVSQLDNQQVVEFDTYAIEQAFDHIEEKLSLMVKLSNFEALQLQVEQDRQHIDELYQLVQTINQELNKKSRLSDQQSFPKSQSESQLPFQISSIERWGDRIYALLVMDGIKNLVSIGDVRAGWRIKELDPYQESALFVNEKSGITIQAFVDRH